MKNAKNDSLMCNMIVVLGDKEAANAKNDSRGYYCLRPQEIVQYYVSSLGLLSKIVAGCRYVFFIRPAAAPPMVGLSRYCEKTTQRDIRAKANNDRAMFFSFHHFPVVVRSG